MSAFASLGKGLYNVVFRRTSTTAIFIVGGAFVFGRAFDPALDCYFASINKGVLLPCLFANEFRRALRTLSSLRANVEGTLLCYYILHHQFSNEYLFFL